MPGSQGLGLPEVEILGRWGGRGAGGGQAASRVGLGRRENKRSPRWAPDQGKSPEHQRDKSLTSLVSYVRPWASYFISLNLLPH